MQKKLSQLLKDIRACTHCVGDLPCGPHPVLQVHQSARLCIVGQAPGRKVHETGIPWDDPSGNRFETFCGGYDTYPDYKAIKWTWDEVGPGIFYHDRKLNERFLTVVS